MALLVSETFLVLACYTTALFVLGVDPKFYLFDANHWWKLLFVTGFIILGFYLQDLYADLRIISRILLVQQVCLSVGCALLGAALLGYVRAELLWGRWLMIIGSLAVIVVIPTWRVFFWKYILSGFSSERVLLMGNSSILGEVIDHLAQRPEFGYFIVGYLCEGEPCGFAVPCLGKVEDVRKVYEEYQPTRIVVGMAERRNRLPVEELLDIRFGGILIEDAADTYEVALQRVCSRKIQPSQLIFSTGLGPPKTCDHFAETLFIRDWDGRADGTVALHVADGSGGKTDIARPHALQAETSGAERTALHGLQVSIHVRGRGSANRSRLGQERRPAHYAHRQMAAEVKTG